MSSLDGPGTASWRSVAAVDEVDQACCGSPNTFSLIVTRNDEWRLSRGARGAPAGTEYPCAAHRGALGDRRTESPRNTRDLAPS